MKIPRGIDGRNLASRSFPLPFPPQETLQKGKRGKRKIEIGQLQRQPDITSEIESLRLLDRGVVNRRSKPRAQDLDCHRSLIKVLPDISSAICEELDRGFLGSLKCPSHNLPVGSLFQRLLKSFRSTYR